MIDWIIGIRDGFLHGNKGWRWGEPVTNSADVSGTDRLYHHGASIGRAARRFKGFFPKVMRQSSYQRDISNARNRGNSEALRAVAVIIDRQDGKIAIIPDGGAIMDSEFQDAPITVIGNQLTVMGCMFRMGDGDRAAIEARGWED